MSATLNYQLRDALPDLLKYGRWDLLTILMLHANVRMRCWPSVDYIHDKYGMSLAVINEAKKWLILHGAIEMVPVGKRFGKEECDLPPRQHVYQLTGELTTESGKWIKYLYSAGDVSENEISYSESSEIRNLKNSNEEIQDNTDSISGGEQVAAAQEPAPVKEKALKTLDRAQKMCGWRIFDLHSEEEVHLSLVDINSTLSHIYQVEGLADAKKRTAEDKDRIAGLIGSFWNWWVCNYPETSLPRRGKIRTWYIQFKRHLVGETVNELASTEEPEADLYSLITLADIEAAGSYEAAVEAKKAKR